MAVKMKQSICQGTRAWWGAGWCREMRTTRSCAWTSKECSSLPPQYVLRLPSGVLRLYPYASAAFRIRTFQASQMLPLLPE